MKRGCAAAIAVSCLSGVLISIMIRLNASLAESIGILESSFMAHAVGALVGFFCVVYGAGLRRLRQVRGLPWSYPLIAGISGVIIVCVENMVIPQVGMVLGVGLFLIGNIVFATVADHFGWFGLSMHKFSLRRLMGVFMAIAGLFMVL
ncbi:MAG: DMT family transporter [Deltaproteobacteria bacterium]|nr:DMT family transporter [Deltaproteobacteria bacterium]